MPAPAEDSSNTSSLNPQSGKLTHNKSSSTGVQFPKEKNGRKNGTAKDSGGGGVLAAVTKNAAKMSHISKSVADSTKPPSPEAKPAYSPSNGNTKAYPLLEALSSEILDTTPAQNTHSWARNVPAFSGSPSNLINLGESPPTFQGEDKLTNLGWTTREQRGMPSGQPSSASPPPSRRRPLSYQSDSNYPQTFDDHRSQVSSYTPRRSSMYAQQPRYPQHPPLPHQVQPHFFSAPDANLLLSPPLPGLIPGELGYHCGFDQLCLSYQDTSKPVVVTGYDGGLNIFAASKHGLTKILSLGGLRGGVYNAKILPWDMKRGRSRQFPLIALVIHGPDRTLNDLGSGNSNTPPLDAASVAHTDSNRGSPKPDIYTEPNEYLQTSVEIYSLSTMQHFATLLTLPKVSHKPQIGPLFAPPSPVGALTILADDGRIVIAAGTTGETWIFQQAYVNHGQDSFRCIGKVWTTVQHGTTTEASSANGLAETDWHHQDPETVHKQYNASILSLNGRWLAYCPATPSSQTSLKAIVQNLSVSNRVPGLGSQAPPQLPSPNCAVETPGGGSVMEQIVKIGTQKVIEAGSYLAQQGFQAWQNYMNKPSQPPNGGIVYPQHQTTLHQFPPTHGLLAPAPLVSKDPGLVSLLDLNLLSKHSSSPGSSLHPMTTFKIPHGCSFLSFAPSGLALFTASSKGDTQFVWDLMRIQYAKSSFLKGNMQGGGVQGLHVRQIAEFSRMTLARVVDVVWASPHGERAAMVTDTGTIHILDLPASAFTWPPPRRRNSPSTQDDAVSESTGTTFTATGVASSAVTSLWTAARPLVGRRRRSSTGISATTVAAQAGHGTQAAAALISRSVGAATGKMNEMRKSGTKLHLPRSPNLPSRGCVLLFSGKRNDSVLAISGGIVRFYTIRNRRADRSVGKQKASKGAHVIEKRIPSLPQIKHAPEIAHGVNQVDDLELTERDIDESRWNTRQSPSPARQGHGTESSIPQAEIESNAPYQPFHTDRRVGLHILSHEEALMSSPSVSTLLSPPQQTKAAKKVVSKDSGVPWAFGGSILTTKLDVGPSHTTDDDFDPLSDHRALPISAIETVMRVGNSTENMEQIVVTTRRRKGTNRLGIETGDDKDEEGFFEDDCEVLDFASQRV